MEEAGTDGKLYTIVTKSGGSLTKVYCDNEIQIHFQSWFSLSDNDDDDNGNNCFV
jgi:hypothetical protein